MWLSKTATTWRLSTPSWTGTGLRYKRELPRGSPLNDEEIMNQLKKFWTEYPTLSNWLVLTIGMVIIVLISARNVGFLPSQWAAVIGATIALAGACAWIISWE